MKKEIIKTEIKVKDNLIGIMRVGNVVESALIIITYLLFYGLVAMTIINVALLIIICWLLHRQ